GPDPHAQVEHARSLPKRDGGREGARPRACARGRARGHMPPRGRRRSAGRAARRSLEIARASTLATMPMSQPWLRTLWLPALALVLAAGCQDNYEMVTAALDSVSDTAMLTDTGTSTESGGMTGETTSELPTTTQPSGGSNSMSGGTDSPTTTGPDPTTSTTAPTTMSTTTTTDTTGWDPTATTGPPATCEGPEDCTGEGSGDLSTFVLPFF